MKIKIFITTYNNEFDLNNCIDSILKSDLTQEQYEIHVINNHSGFKCAHNNIILYNNQTRPDFSTGHLSRSWNQCIINGFKNINSPDCDVLITSQDDVIFKPNFWSLLKPKFEKYTFIQLGAGDSVCCYTSKSVYNVGMWDERFCNIGYQEGDYFLRQLLYNRDFFSISDFAHGRSFEYLYPAHSAREIDNEYISIPKRNTLRQNNHTESLKFHAHSEFFFSKKWGISSVHWDTVKIVESIKTPKIESYVLYPYFEYGLNVEYLKNTQLFVFK